jgi:hypothetical protein
MTLVSGDIYADTDSAAALLEAQHKPSEALQFLRPLADSSPWNAGYKVRYATALLATDAQSHQAITILQAVVADTKARYQDRVSAAQALKGKAPVSGSSAELALLARVDCPHPEDASKPYFVAARVAAAACATTDASRESLLRDALATAPSGAQVRLSYVWAAFAAGENARALLAAQPFLQNEPSWVASQYQPAQDTDNDGEAAADDASGAPDYQLAPASPPALTTDDIARLYRLAIHALEEQHDTAEALQFVSQLDTSRFASAVAQEFADDRKRLEAIEARERENESRAPQIHEQLEQSGVVRPRLRPGDPIGPAKTSDKEDAE